MSNEYRKASWGLASDPFYPETLADGSALDPEASETDLRPDLDPKVFRLFFDIYDWDDSPLLKKLSKENGIASFPDKRSLPSNAPLMVIISGPSHSGLDSLANLVSFKVAEKAKMTLLESKVELDGRDASANVRGVAEVIIDSVEYKSGIKDAAAVAKTMYDRLQRSVAASAGQANPSFSDVFRAFDMILAPAKRCIVIRILKGGDHDSWARIYGSAKDLADCVIVTTPDAAFAKTCYDAMNTSKQNVTWIKARPLDLDVTRKFVEERLGFVKMAGAPGANFRYAPFTEEALDVLFQPGTNPRAEVITHPVGWIRQTLHQALEDQLVQIRATVKDDLPSVPAHPDFPFLVDAERMIAARTRLNQGE
jgi:hypothetical protein